MPDMHQYTKHGAARGLVRARREACQQLTSVPWRRGGRGGRGGPRSAARAPSFDGTTQWDRPHSPCTQDRSIAGPRPERSSHFRRHPRSSRGYRSAVALPSMDEHPQLGQAGSAILQFVRPSDNRLASPPLSNLSGRDPTASVGFPFVLQTPRPRRPRTVTGTCSS